MEEEGSKHRMTHTGQQKDSLATRSGAEAAAGLGDDDDNGDSVTLK